MVNSPVVMVSSLTLFTKIIIEAIGRTLLFMKFNGKNVAIYTFLLVCGSLL